MWTLPKGALNPGESAADAALREVREETGWECEVVRELDAVTYWFQRDGRRIRKTVRWYLMRPLRKAGEHDHEVDEVLWTDPGDARARLRYESDLKLVNTMGGPEWPPIPPNAQGGPAKPGHPSTPREVGLPIPRPLASANPPAELPLDTT